ncbi:threonine dehydratase [Candidatus Kinetoplastibacterium desouzaii TCC079E]|uniref:Threonine dehydratase n=1 Tax=Candidatus Kinetoplastidibacterium desouzai TCC079E TaxID=1208919 RepID=M1LLL3_9PROT|nr:pyridoxal-phosphate dependent enzyme [Candidatus Kinetoplastibacterium desouzaii]AGF46642.1 threonine dehydratase [Candidatus Kinetoplastibacterium desouzaii TCC079E]
MDKEILIPSFQEILQASKRIANYVYKTPVLTSEEINNKFGANFFFKCENMQRTNAFKFRGALNALAKLNDKQKKIGVVTFSSGNHAKAIALASDILGVNATIIVPNDAPKTKINTAKQHKNCNFILYNRYNDNREEILNKFVKQNKLIPISSYDNNDVIAGSGTVLKELFEEISNLDAIFIGLGGGGLLAGSSIVMNSILPKCKIYGAEPETGNDGQISFQTGILTKIDTPNTIADGAQTQCLGKSNFAIIKKYVENILTVSDSELINCMYILANELKIISEPTGCLGFAASLKIIEQLQNKRIGVIITGGNVDLENFWSLIKTKI